MALGAIAGALSGAGEATHRNRERRRADESFNILREEADRVQDQYQKQQAWRQIMESFPDPTSMAEQAGQAAPGNQPIMGQGGLPGAGTAAPGDTLGVLGVGGAASTPPKPKPKSYRETRAAWDQNAKNLAMQAGGLPLVNEYEKWKNHTTQQMVLSYGEQAEILLNGGDVAGAAKLANTALEATPLDIGMKFFPKNGELYMEGPTGEVNGPYNAEQFDALFQQHMKTPENWMEIDKAAEEKRAAKVDEGFREREIKISESAEKRLKKYAERVMQAEEGRVLASLITAKASDKRAMSSIERALMNNGWDVNDIVRVMNLTEDFTLDNFTELSPEVKEYYDTNPKALSDLKSDISYLQLENTAGTLDPNKAAVVSQLIRQPGGIDAGQVGADFTIVPKANGRLAGILDGREFWLTPELENVYFKRVPEAKADLERMMKTVQPPSGNQGGEKFLTPEQMQEEADAQSQWEAMLDSGEAIPTG